MFSYIWHPFHSSGLRNNATLNPYCVSSLCGQIQVYSCTQIKSIAPHSTLHGSNAQFVSSHHSRTSVHVALVFSCIRRLFGHSGLLCNNESQVKILAPHSTPPTDTRHTMGSVVYTPKLQSLALSIVKSESMRL